jgi:hypothetical protein
VTDPGLQRQSAKGRVALRRPGPRGWTNRGGGAAAYVEMAPEWRGTSVQVCGLWPFIAGSGSPMVGVPLGRHLFTNTTVCSDPINWFTRAKLISNPGVFILGLTGRGKSTVVRRMATGLAAFGTNPIVFGDTKPDYADLRLFCSFRGLSSQRPGQRRWDGGQCRILLGA